MSLILLLDGDVIKSLSDNLPINSFFLLSTYIE